MAAARQRDDEDRLPTRVDLLYSKVRRNESVKQRGNDMAPPPSGMSCSVRLQTSSRVSQIPIQMAIDIYGSTELCRRTRRILRAVSGVISRRPSQLILPSVRARVQQTYAKPAYPVF